VSRQQVEELLAILKYQLFKGWQCLCIAKQLHLQYGKTGRQDAIYFFSGAARACIDQAILTFATVIDGQDKLSLEAFQREIKLLLPKLAPEIQAALEVEIGHLSTLLSKLKPLRKEVYHWRNNVIAHTSRHFFTDPEVMAAHPPLIMNNLEQGYRDLFAVLTSFGHILDVDTASLDTLQAKITADIAYLMGLLKAVNEPPALPDGTE
jgi:hypothetical protein